MNTTAHSIALDEAKPPRPTTRDVRRNAQAIILRLVRGSPRNLSTPPNSQTLPVSPREIASRLGAPPSTVYRWVDARKSRRMLPSNVYARLIIATYRSMS